MRIFIKNEYQGIMPKRWGSQAHPNLRGLKRLFSLFHFDGKRQHLTPLMLFK
jgi:hypothetical protein